MILYINTIAKDKVVLKLKKKEAIIAKEEFAAKFQQAEKLLPGIEKFLKKNRISLKDIKMIEVENRGGSFTCLRIGVTTANALGFALKIPVKGLGRAESRSKKNDFSIVKPVYDREPNITIKKQK